MFSGAPNKNSIIGNTLTATGTLITVPAGHWFTGNGTISATVSVAGTSQPKVTVNGTNAHPAGGTVLTQINVSGLATSTSSDSSGYEILVYADTNDITIDFTAGAAGTSSASIVGYYF